MFDSKAHPFDEAFDLTFILVDEEDNESVELAKLQLLKDMRLNNGDESIAKLLVDTWNTKITSGEPRLIHNAVSNCDMDAM